MKNNFDGVLAMLPSSDEDESIYNKIVKDNYSRRVLIINEEISDDIFEYICMSILRFNLEDRDLPVTKRKRIKIVLNSNGGDAILGDQILSSITTSKTPVDVIGFSKCMSMACYILAAGAKRYCYPSTIILWHDGSTGYVTSANKGKDIQKFYDELDEREKQFMIEHTNMSEEFLEDIKDREYYMFPEEAKELGIIDGIIGKDISLEKAFE